MRTFMSACRGTPRRFASRSSDSTIHSGKSTLTLFSSWPGRRAFARSRACVMSSPAGFDAAGNEI